MSMHEHYEQVLGDDVGETQDENGIMEDFEEQQQQQQDLARFGQAFRRLSQDDSSSYDEVFVDDDKTEPTSNVHHNTGKLTPATLSETPVEQHENGDSTAAAAKGISSSNQLNPFASFDDLDDDELDDLQRYDFHGNNSESERLRTFSTNNSQWSNGNAGFVSSLAMGIYVLWDMFQTARQEATRRRAEKLLAMPDEHYIERFCLFVTSWCDLTDRGMYLLIAVVVFVVLAFLHDGDSWWLWVGVPLVILRMLLRPAYWYLWGRRVERKRRETMALYDELNASPAVGGRVIIEMPEHANGEKSELPEKENGGFSGDLPRSPFERDLNDAGNPFSDTYAQGLGDGADKNTLDLPIEQQEPHE